MDAFSGAASVIGVVSLAIQLADCVKKLCDFWEAVGDAPESVRTVIAELTLLSAVTVSSAGQVSSPGLELALESCKTRIESMMLFTSKFEKDLGSGSKSKRKWAAMKVVFKTERIEQFLLDLERTKTTLLLAYQVQMNTTFLAGVEEIRQSQNMMMQHLVAGNFRQANSAGSSSGLVYPAIRLQLESGDECMSLASNDSLVKTSNSTRSTWHSGNQANLSSKWREIAWSYTQLNSLFGKFSLKSQTYAITTMSDIDEDPQHKSRTLMVVRPALWLTRFGIKYEYRLAMLQSPGLGKWTYNLDTFRPVPDNSLIFSFCKQGNIEGVKLLLKRGEASIWDTGSYGYTPLHWATHCMHPELCSFLIEAGADREVRADGDVTCFDLACVAYASYYEPMIIKTQISRARLCLLQIFIEQLDLSDYNGVGWSSISELLGEGFKVFGLSHEPSPESLGFDWLVSTRREYLIQNLDGETLSEILYDLWWRYGTEYTRKVMADLNITTLMIHPGDWTPLHYYLKFQDFEAARSLVHQGIFLHSSASDEYWSLMKETPTSISLYSSPTFSAWRRILVEEQLLLEDFVTRELENECLWSEGWRKDTLMTVFTFDFEPAECEAHLRCDRCIDLDSRFGDSMSVEIAWQRLLHEIKLDMDPHEVTKKSKDRETDEEDSQLTADASLRQDQSHAVVTNRLDGETQFLSADSTSNGLNNGHESGRNNYEWVCLRCWHYFGVKKAVLGYDIWGEDVDIHESRDNDDEDSDEDSPFLLSF